MDMCVHACVDMCVCACMYGCMCVDACMDVCVCMHLEGRGQPWVGCMPVGLRLAGQEAPWPTWSASLMLRLYKCAAHWLLTWVVVTSRGILLTWAISVASDLFYLALYGIMLILGRLIYHIISILWTYMLFLSFDVLNIIEHYWV